MIHSRRRSPRCRTAVIGAAFHRLLGASILLLLSAAVSNRARAGAASDRVHPASLNLVRNPGFEQGTAGWLQFGGGFVVDDHVARSGKASARLDKRSPGTSLGARQVIVLDQTVPDPVFIRAWTRAQDARNVSGKAYSVYADVEYRTDTRPGRVDLPGQAAAFSPGTYDWRAGSVIVCPKYPIREIRLYLLFRGGCTGTVWFDDVEVRSLSPGPLAGPVHSLPPAAPGTLPAAFIRTFERTPRDFVVKADGAPGAHVQVQGRTVALLQPEQEEGVTTFPVHAMRFLSPGKAGTPALRFVFLGGEPVLEITVPAATAGRQTAGTKPPDDAALRWLAAFPEGVEVRRTTVEGWTPDRDAVRLLRYGNRAVLETRITRGAAPVRLALHLKLPGKQTPGRVPPPDRAEAELRAGGLAVEWAGDGRVAGLQVGDRRFLPIACAPEAVPGFVVADFLGPHPEVMRGTVKKAAGAESALTIEAEAPASGVRLQARCTATGGRIDVAVTLEDALRRGDRALDLLFNLPIDLRGWQWHEDITTSRPVPATGAVTSGIYPWAVVTPPDGGSGLALALHPESPCVYRFRADGRTRCLQLRLPVALIGDAATPWTAHFRFSVFPVDGRWGFRDAVRRYYTFFPEHFRRIAPRDGGWLFACPLARVPNPEDYAYREGGPAGWELDEKAGILTCPYRIPTQRQIVLPRLPADDDAARALIRRLASTPVPDGWQLRSTGGAQTVDDAPRSGRRCLRFSRAAGDPPLWAKQTIHFPAPQSGLLLLEAWCRTSGVSGEPDADFSLYADLFPVHGRPIFGCSAPFPVGTHGWKRVRARFEVDRPLREIRVYLLMRGNHVGTAWFDDVAVRLSAPDARNADNRIVNPGFEQGTPLPTARMMMNCAALDRTGRMYVTRRDNVGADVIPKHPIYNVVTPVNCDPALFSDQPDRLTVGRSESKTIGDILARYPRIDGVYLDSISGWISWRRNYRREHFPYVRGPFCYDAGSGTPYVPGWMHTYAFMRALQRRLTPAKKVVFPNIGRGRRLPFLYFVSDVIGLEGGLRTGDFESRLNFYRTLAYHKPVLVMEYLELAGKPTRFDSRAEFERLWKWCTLYGVYPSVGRSCVEAWKKFSDVYRAFREPLHALCAAGWEPIPHASVDDGIRIERFGSMKQNRLYFVVFNPGAQSRTARVRIDGAALGLGGPVRVVEMMSGRRLSTPPWTLSLQPEELAVLVVTPE